MNKKRLLKVAQALRESPEPKKFTMQRYAHSCGTPACALGHYAARSDLQRTFKLKVSEGDTWGDYDNVVVARPGFTISVLYDDVLVQDHFGITFEQACDLFSSEGCGGARTPLQAAKFIERFAASVD